MFSRGRFVGSVLDIYGGNGGKREVDKAGVVAAPAGATASGPCSTSRGGPQASGMAQTWKISSGLQDICFSLMSSTGDFVVFETASAIDMYLF